MGSRQRFADAGICRHCSKKKINRPRGLCWTCYYSPVRDLYGAPNPKTAKYAGFAKTAVNTGYAPSRPVPAHMLTSAEPGSEDKIRAMELRYLLGLSLTDESEPRYESETYIPERLGIHRHRDDRRHNDELF